MEPVRDQGVWRMAGNHRGDIEKSVLVSSLWKVTAGNWINDKRLRGVFCLFVCFVFKRKGRWGAGGTGKYLLVSAFTPGPHRRSLRAGEQLCFLCTDV